jgi:acetyl-CoA/propionyl-CoA carboxylase biotin carboxyl carrier protein
VHTRWIETEFQAEIAPYLPPDADSGEPPPREPVIVEVGGRRVEVVLPASLLPSASRQVEGVTGRASRPPRHARKTAAPGTTGATLASPMQGTIVKVMVAEGERVQAGDLVVVLEAMKMEQPITAHRSGVVRNLMAAVGVTVNSGAPLCDIEEA